MSTPIRIYLIDDHVLVRNSLRLLIEGQTDLTVIGEAGTLDEAAKLIAFLKPHVLSLDISMPTGGGLKGLPLLKKQLPDLRVVVLTMHDDASYVHAALATGADAYVLKSSPPSVYIEAIRQVALGRAFIDPAVSAKVAAAPPTCGPSDLSTRELQVLRLLAEGLTYLQIADRLFLSVKTVETYRSRLFQKLGLTSKADLVRFALESGILTSDVPLNQAES